MKKSIFIVIKNRVAFNLNDLMLKKIGVCVLIFFCCSKGNSQLGIYISPGAINYGGDLQNSFFTFKQSSLSLSAGIMYQVNKFAARSSITYGKVQGSDIINGLFKQRNLSFYTHITEINLALQYDLFLLSDEQRFTPYFFAGVGYFHFDPYTYYNDQKIYLQALSTEGQGLSIYPDKKPYSLSEMNAPLGIGLKYKLSDAIQLSVEFCSRYLFTDYLDDVSSAYPDESTLLRERGQTAVDLSFRGDEIDPALTFPAGQSRGNPTHNDNYYTTSFSFIYVFAKHTMYNNGSGTKMRYHKNCPPKLK